MGTPEENRILERIQEGLKIEINRDFNSDETDSYGYKAILKFENKIISEDIFQIYH